MPKFWRLTMLRTQVALARRGLYATTSSSRAASAWINRAGSDADASSAANIDVERLFTEPQVQDLLTRLRGLDLQNKVFRSRRISTPQDRSHYALMTDERWNKTMERMEEEASLFLHFVPVKEPRENKTEVLAVDHDIAGFDTSKFVFTDISFDATNQDRTVVVRETDGTLRTADPEEHDRMNRVYYNQPNRPVVEPQVFSDPWLAQALDRNEHEFIMDWACWFFEVDDPKFVQLSKTVFDRIVAEHKFDALHSTRHFGPLVFYLALNGNIPPLLNFFGARGMLAECANLVRLQKTLHPDWRVAITSADSDMKIVQDFIKQNGRFKPQLPDLLAFLQDGTIKVRSPISMEMHDEGSNADRKMSTVSAANVTTASGPLGDLSAEYEVKVDLTEAAKKENEDSKKSTLHRKQRSSRSRRPKKPTPAEEQ